MIAHTNRSLSRRYRLLALLVILSLLFQPLVPLFDTPAAKADDEFEPWCGNDCEDPDDDDDGNGGCEEGDSTCSNNCSAGGGSTINFFTGEEIDTTIDLFLPGFLPLAIARTYRSQSFLNTRFGFGWDLSINQRLQRQSDGSVVINNGFCGRYIFKQEDGEYETPPGLFLTLSESADGGFALREQDSLTRRFDVDGKLAAIQDRFGNQIRFTYHPAGKLPIIGVSRFFRSQQRGVIGYDYQLTTITDSTGRTITFAYNTDGRLTTITYGNNRRIEYQYDTNDNLVAVIDEAGQRTTYRYEDSRDPNNLTAVADNDDQALVERLYDSEDRVIRERVEGHTATVSYQTERGRMKTALFTNGRGDRTRYEFDARGNTTRVQQVRAPADGGDVLTQLTYNSQNQLTFARRAANTGSSMQSTAYTYHDSGRVTAVSTSSGQRFATVYDPDLFLQPAQVTNLVGGVSSYTYDADQQLDRYTTPLGQQYRFEWSPQGQMAASTDPLGNTVRYTYDAAGNLVTVTDALGVATNQSYDELGQIRAIEDALGNGIDFAYDAVGQLTGMTNALGETHALAYDSRGNLIRYTDPNGRTITMTYSAQDNFSAVIDQLGQTTSLVYDGANNLIEKRDGNGVTTHYRYNAFGLLTAIGNGAPPIITYAYDALTNMIAANTTHLALSHDYSNGLPGQPSQVRFQGRAGNPVNATVTYDYLMPGATAGAGERWRSGLVYGLTVQSAGGPALTLAYDYDPLFNLTELRSSGIATLRYTFDYDAATHLVHMGPAANSAGVQTDATYDAADRITRWTNRTADGGQTLQNFIYAYDPIGNATVVTETVAGAGTRYTYDDAYQLTRALLPDGADLRYIYDPAGNRTAQISNGATITYTYDVANQLIASSAHGGTDYTYDGNGNLRTRLDDRGMVTYTWNTENELIRIEYADGTFSAYQYDALGRRSSRTDRASNTTYYVYDGYNLVQEIDETGAIEATYVHSQMIDHPLSMTRDGETYYYLYDGQGSVIGLADRAGTLVAAYRYGPWGESIGGFDGGIENPFRFKGREWDEDSALYFLRTRYYDPEIGRFIQRDKIGLAGGWNLYLYAQNNPVNFADPTGEIIPILVGIAIGAGIELGIQLLQNGGKFECVNWWMVGLSGALGGLGGYLNGARALSNTGRLLLGRNNYGLRRLFWDNRTFHAVSQQYWRLTQGGATAAGNQLGHIWVRNSATWVPQGLRNAGFNLVELPRAINHWGGRSVWNDRLIRTGIGGLLGWSGYQGYRGGSALGRGH